MKPDVVLEIRSRTEAFGGTRFGIVGKYERLVGIAHIATDPRAPENRNVVDIDLAPVGADGRVHFDVDVEILRPVDPAKAKPVLVYEVVNRGMKVMLGSDTKGGQAASNLLNRGYTVMWSGWQGDAPAGPFLGSRVPVATDHGRPITERIEAEAVFDDLVGNRIALAYPTADLGKGKAVLAVRARADDPAQTIAATDWQYADDRHVVIKRPPDMDAGAIYRFSYLAKDPKVIGLGFVGVRDLVSFVRHGTAKNGNPLALTGKATCTRQPDYQCSANSGDNFNSVVAVGLSQSGRFLRDFVWQGFNKDMTGNRVFDGIVPVVAGARRTFTNMRFSEPGRFSRQHEDHEVPGFSFPFAYTALIDPSTGKTGGILDRCDRDGTCPKVFHVDSSTEFWQGGSSLVGTDAHGRDVEFPANVRAYFVAGTSHAPGIVASSCQYAANDLNYAPVVRSLLVAMIDWTLGLKAPPASQWPRRDRHELVSLDELKTPDLSAIGVSWPAVVNRPVAPAKGPLWPIWVPQVDGDGNDLAGVRLPQLAVPAGTYLGWNLRRKGFAEGELCSSFGGFIPFALDRRARGDDPRLSLAERSNSSAGKAKAASAIRGLQASRLLLDDDAAAMLAEYR